MQENQNPREKRIIIDDLSSYEQEMSVSRAMRKRSGLAEFFKSVFVLLLLVGIVVGSFWVSFLLGKKVLLPVKTLETKELTPIEERIPDIEAPKLHENVILAEIPTVEEEELEPPAKVVVPKTVPLEQNRYYKVQAGVFSSRIDAAALVDRLKAAGFSAFIRKLPNGTFRVQAGAFRTRSQAQVLVTKLSVKHFESIIIYE